MSEKLARLMAGTIRFSALRGDGSYEAEQVLGYNQKVSITRNAETKELYSNDERLGESVAEVETKVTYEFSAEIGDLSIQALAVCLKGLVEQKTYAVGESFWNGKIIKASSEKASIGDVILDKDKLYTVTTGFNAGAFADDKCAPKVYSKTAMLLKPETRAANFGRMIVEGTNLATGKPQILVIPKISLRFEGDFALIADDFAKLALKGKILKKDSEDLFTLIDGENA